MRSVSVLTRAIRSPVRLPPKNSSERALHVGVGPVAQVDGDPLAHPGQHEGPGPGQKPSQNRRPRRIPADTTTPDGSRRLAPFGRLQHVVDQRHGQIRRHQAGARAGHHQREPQQDHPLPRLGEADQPVERAEGRLVLGRAAIGTGRLLGRQDRPATRTDDRRRLGRLFPAGQFAPGEDARTGRPADVPPASGRSYTATWQSSPAGPSSSSRPVPVWSLARKAVAAWSGQERTGNVGGTLRVPCPPDGCPHTECADYLCPRAVGRSERAIPAHSAGQCPGRVRPN